MVARSVTMCRCLVRKYVKGHCRKDFPSGEPKYHDVYILTKCPCPPFDKGDGCKERKRRRKRRRRKRQHKHSFVRHVRYREKLHPGSNTPVLVGTLSSWRYGVDNYFSSARPWYDPTGISGVRMWDENHPPLRLRPDWYRVSATGVHASPENADFGGPMRLIRTHCPWHERSGDITVDNGDPGFLVSYTGGFVPTWFGNHPDPPPWGDAWSEHPDSMYGDATQYGAEGFARAKQSLLSGPVDLAAAIYELKDLPEQLATTARGFRDLYKDIGGRDHSDLMSPRSVADHFINHQFGWAPFISDVFDTYKAFSGLKQAIEQQKRSNSRWIRRRRTVEHTKEVNLQIASDHYAYAYPDIAGLTRWDTAPDGTVTRGYSSFRHETELRAWFSGEFRYWLPSLVHDDHDMASWAVNRMRYLGIRISPALVWKLTPWSWLADWLSQDAVRQLVDALSGDDTIVSRYAYAMCHLIKRTTHQAVIHLVDGNNAYCSWTAFVESKRRARASPFGFGLSSTDLSGRQLSILAALGISRSWGVASRF